MKRFSALCKQPAGANQISKTFFRDQTTDCHDQRRSRRKIRASEFREIQPIVNAINAIRAIWESLSQESRGVIGHGNDYARCIDKLIEPNLEISRRKNVVGVCGKTKCDWKKSGDPESRARRHSREVRVNMANPHFSQAQADIYGLVKAQKIGAAVPFIESTDDFRRQLSFFGSAMNFT